MLQSGDVFLRRRSIRSTGRSSKTHGAAQELDDKLPKASKHFQGEEWKTPGIDSFKRLRKWSEEEDKIVIQMVNLHGPNNWSIIADAVPGRCRRQCRDRWVYYLDPAVNKQPWSEQEEITLIHAHKIHGNKWLELAKLFPGRTNKAVKNHWAGLVRRKLQSYLSKGLLEKFENLPDDPTVPKNGGSGTLKGSHDASKNNQLPSDLLVTPKSEQGLTETSENTSTLDGKSSSSVNSGGFGTLSVDVTQNVDGQIARSKFPVVTGKKMALSSSSVDLKVSVAAPSVLSSMKNENPMSSPELSSNYANTGLSLASSSQSSYGYFDEICGATDPELPELHLENIADLIDMSYCESMMIVPPDSPHGEN